MIFRNQEAPPRYDDVSQWYSKFEKGPINESSAILWPFDTGKAHLFFFLRIKHKETLDIYPQLEVM